MITGAIAVLLFLLTASAINRYVKGLEAPAASIPAPPPAARVVVAADDVPLGTRLKSGHLRTVSWPKDAMPPGAIGDPLSIVGSVAVASLVRNEPVLPDKLADGGHSLLPLVIPPGMRAVSIRVSDVTGISGFVVPGSKVDVIVVMSSENLEGGRGAYTILDNVEVLAVAQDMDARETKPKIVKTVTLLVTPHQAERLAVAGGIGTLQLALRNYQDQRPVYTSGVLASQLTFDHRPDVHTVEVINGAKRIVRAF
jgi:pilus assembly protein CpaB